MRTTHAFSQKAWNRSELLSSCSATKSQNTIFRWNTSIGLFKLQSTNIIIICTETPFFYCYCRYAVIRYLKKTAEVLKSWLRVVSHIVITSVLSVLHPSSVFSRVTAGYESGMVIVINDNPQCCKTLCETPCSPHTYRDPPKIAYCTESIWHLWGAQQITSGGKVSGIFLSRFWDRTSWV